MAHLRQRSSPIHTIYRHRVDLIVLAVYIAIGAIFTLPLPFTMNRCLAGDDIDAWLNPWANWWTQKALSERLPFYYTRYLFYPHGVSLVYHSFSHTNSAMWLVLRQLMGDLPAHNLTILMTYPLSAFTLYLLARHLLARHLTGSRFAAFVAGFIFAFSPYHVAESSHPVLGTTQWIPLFMLSLEKALTQQKIKAGLFAALWLWLTALSGWHLLTLALFLGACRALYLLFTMQRWRSWKTLRVLLIAAVAFAVLILPFMWPLLREQITSDAPTYILALQEPYAGTDLLAFFMPSNYHPLFGPYVSRIYERFYPGLWQRPAFIGYSVLVLGCVGIWRSGRRGRFWWMASVVLFVLALGPYPRVLGARLLPYPVPWGVPLARLIRYGERVNVLLTLCWSLLAAWGCVALMQRVNCTGSRRRVWLLAAGMLVLIAFEYCPVPFPSTCVQVPRFYTALAQEPDDSAILEIPMGRQPAKISMYYQTIHRHPLVDGHVSRTPAYAYDFIEGKALLSLLRQYSSPGHGGPFSLPFPDVSRQLSTLADAGIRYIVFHRDETAPGLLAAWQSFVVTNPVYEDASLVVYRTRPIPGADYCISARLTEEIGLVKIDGALPSTISQASWLEFDLHWTALAPPLHDYRCRLALHDSAGQAVAAYDVALAAQWPTSQWPAGTLYTSHFAVQIDPFLPAGTLRVTIVLVNPATTQAVGSAEDLGFLKVQALPRQYTRHPASIHVDDVFGDQIRLLGYDVEPTTTQLSLTFHWQAIRRMEQDYKFFVHLFSLNDGTIVAQDDRMPRHWTYPTSWWDKGEIVTDTVCLDTSKLSSGQYKVAVGIYEPDTMERLPVVDQSGALLPEQMLVLPFVLDVK